MSKFTISGLFCVIAKDSKNTEFADLTNNELEIFKDYLTQTVWGIDCIIIEIIVEIKNNCLQLNSIILTEENEENIQNYLEELELCQENLHNNYCFNGINNIIIKKIPILNDILNVPLLNIINHNDSFRNYTNTGLEDLYTLTEVNNTQVNHNFKYPTLMHRTESSEDNMISQKKYSDILLNKYPFMKELFKNVNGIILGGGGAEWVFSKKTLNPKDLDFFIFKPDDVIIAEPNNLNFDKNQTWQTKQWKQLSTAVNIIFKFYKNHNIYQTFTKGLFTLEINTFPENIQIQFILRDYTSHSQILHGFDLSSCAISFDGTTTRFTALGAWSYLTKLNIVWPAYRSPSYEHRLVKYWNKGYGLVFVHMQEFTLGVMNLPYLMLNIIYISGNFAYGNIFLESNIGYISDYSPSKTNYILSSSQIYENIRTQNIYNILQKKDIYTFYQKYSPYNKTNKINLASIAKHQCLNEIIPTEWFNSIIDRLPYEFIYIKAQKIIIDFYLLKQILFINIL